MAIAAGGGGGGGSNKGAAGAGGAGDSGSGGVAGTSGGCTGSGGGGASGTTVGAAGTCSGLPSGSPGSGSAGGAGGSDPTGGGGGGGGYAGGGGGASNSSGGNSQEAAGGGGGGSSDSPTSGGGYTTGSAAATAGSISITVTLGAVAANSSFSTQPPSSVANGATFSTTVTEKDFNNSTVNDPAQLAIATQPSGPTASLHCTTNPVTPSSGGVAAFSGCTIVGPTGTYTLKATDNSNTVSIATSSNITLMVGTFSKFTVTPTTSTPTAGSSDNLTLTAMDSGGNTVTSYTGSECIDFSGPQEFTQQHGAHVPGQGDLLEQHASSQVTFSSGVASSVPVTLVDATHNPVTLTAEDHPTGNSGTTTLTVSPATAATFSLSTPSPTAGSSFNETLTALDAYGNTATGYSGTKTISYSGPANAPNGTAPSYPSTATSVTFSSGLGTASTITLYDAASGVTLGATDGTVSGTSASFTVSPTTPSQVGFTTEPPTTGTAGTALTSFAVAVQDQYQNIETGSNTGNNDTINLTVATGPGSIASGASANASGGTATFSSTIIDVAGSYTLKATDGSRSITTATSTPATVIGPATAATFTLSTPSPTAGASFNETLTALDSFGNTATGYSGTKTITFSGPANSPDANAPSYPATVSFTSGVGTASITLYDAASGVTLHATDGTISGTSAAFTVAPTTAASFGLSTPSPTAGSSFNETVTALDAYGNTATGYSGTKTITFSGPANAPGGNAPSYPANVSFTSGVGTASITLYDAASGVTLGATDGTISGTSASFTVSPATAAKLVFTSAPTTQTASSSAGTSAFVVQVRDTYGNAVTNGGSAATVTPSTTSTGTTFFTTTSGGSSSSGTVTIANGASSSNSFYYADTKVGTWSISASATVNSVSVSTSPNASISITPATAATFSLSTPSPTAGSSFSETLTALDSFGNTATGYSGTKTITFSGPANSPDANAPSYPATVSFTSGAGTASITLYDAASGVTLHATDGTVSGTSASFTVAPATAASFGLSTPSPTAGTSFNETLTALDAYGNTATGYSGTKTISYSGPANAPNGTAPSYPSTATSVTFSSGVGTASTITLYDAASGVTLHATDGTISGTSASFTVSPTTPSQVGFTTEPPTAGTAGTALTSFAVAVQDQYQNIETGSNTGNNDTINLTVATGPGSIASGASANASGGTATFSSTIIDVAGSYTLKATDGSRSITTATSTPATVIGPATAASFTLSTPSPTAGSSFNETLTALDSFGNTATGYSGTKTITFSGPANSPDANAPSYPATVSFTSGVGTASITLYDAASGVTLHATDGTISGTSAAFTVAPTTAASFGLSTPSPTAGSSFSETLTALDAYGNTANSYGGSVAITFSGPANAPNGASPSYPATVSFTSGVGTASITLYDAASGVTLGATDGTISGTSASFTVAPATPDHVSFTTEPPTAGTAGTALTSFAVAVQDQYQNIETGSNTGNNDTINLTVATGPGSIASGASANASGGTATFSSTIIDVAGSYTLKATDGSRSITTATSTPATVIGPATAATFTLSTPSPTAGASFNETLTALDSFGNTATGYSGTKTITFSGPANSPDATAPSYPATVSFTSGVGTASITLYDAASGVTLGATDGTISGTSASFTVAPATAATFSLSTPSPTAGSSFNETLTALDAFGNTAAGYSGTKTVTFSGPANSPDANAPSYPATVSFTSGVGTASITLYDAASGVTLGATDGTISGTSASFTVAPATAATFSLSTPSPTAGSSFSETLTALDAYGNTATGYGGSVAITFSGPANAPNGASPSYPATVSFTSGAGTASITLYDAASGVTLGATDGTISGTSASFTVVPGSPDHVSFTTEPPTTGTAGTALTSFAVSVQDAYNNLENGSNPGNNDTINLTVATGPGSIASGATATASGGVATFTSTIVDVAGSYTFTATDASETLGTDTSTPATVIGLQSTTTTITSSANPSA